MTDRCANERPGATGLCIGAPGPDGSNDVSCTSTDRAIEGRLVIGSRDERGIGTIAGLMPDGVDTVHLAVGPTSPAIDVPVVSDVWVARESDSPDATATLADGGSLAVPLP